MTDEEHNMIKKTHDFWFVAPVEGKPTRAEQIDEVLGAVRAGKIGSRAILWLAGLVAAFGVLWAQMNGGSK